MNCIIILSICICVLYMLLYMLYITSLLTRELTVQSLFLFVYLFGSKFILMVKALMSSPKQFRFLIYWCFCVEMTNKRKTFMSDQITIWTLLLIQCVVWFLLMLISKACVVQWKSAGLRITGPKVWARLLLTCLYPWARCLVSIALLTSAY